MHTTDLEDDSFLFKFHAEEELKTKTKSAWFFSLHLYALNKYLKAWNFQLCIDRLLFERMSLSGILYPGNLLEKKESRLSPFAECKASSCVIKYI